MEAILSDSMVMQARVSTEAFTSSKDVEAASLTPEGDIQGWYSAELLGLLQWCSDFKDQYDFAGQYGKIIFQAKDIQDLHRIEDILMDYKLYVVKAGKT